MEYVESSRPDAFNPKFEIASRVSTQTFPQVSGESTSRALLVQRELKQVTIAGCHFDHAQLLGSQLDRCRFYDTTFSGTEINGTDFMDCAFTRVKFRTRLLRNARFERCTFTDCVFQSESGEPIDPADGVRFIDVIYTGMSFMPPLPKATREEIIKNSWNAASATPPPVAAVEPAPLAIVSPPSTPPPSATPVPKKNDDNRFGSLEL